MARFAKARANGPARKSLVANKLQAALLRSGLFQPRWYLTQNPDLPRAGLDLLDHFLRIGGFEGRSPNPMFDAAWYLKQNPDVAKEKMNPLVHYVLFGEKENRNPSLYFDVEWYRSAYGSELQSDGALAHYLKNARLNRFQPNPFFDPVFYLARNPDVATAGVDPLRHFLSNGWREFRNPSDEFDVRFYAAKFLHDDPRDPLTHYLEVGRSAGFPTRHGQDQRHSVADEVRRFSARSDDFEEVDPGIAQNLKRRAKAFAFYLPQFHAIPENDAWWGKGFTEWTNVARGMPRFVGHYQPRIPRDFGFYDLNDPSIMPRQITAAKAAGLEGFCFYYYNFNGKRLLEKPVNEFLSRGELGMSFCLMWANENWTRRWDGCEAETLMSQDYRDEDCEALIDDFARHFADPRYFRINGKPLLLLYRVDIIPNPEKTVARWRELFRERHSEEPLIVLAQGFGNYDPAAYGFDGAIEFPPHKVTANLKWTNSECTLLDPSFTASILKYDDIVAASMAEASPAFPLIKTVMPSWDNDARRQGRGMSVIGSSPAKYENWLDQALTFAKANPFHGERLVFINAWNEWAEAAYLEPDVHFGGAYLNATARALVGLTAAPGRRKILLVADEAAGASEEVLIEMGQSIRRQFGGEIRFLLNGEGISGAAYREVGPTLIAKTSEQLRTHLKALSAGGFKNAIVNSVYSAALVPTLKANHIRVLALVDEPFERDREAWLNGARTIAQKADQIAFRSGEQGEAFSRALQAPIRARLSLLGRDTERDPSAKERLAFLVMQRLEAGLRSVSVVVPNYNYAHYLLERLRSVFDQSYPVFEIIVLDDCSTDDSLARLSEIAAVTKRRIQIVRGDVNSGNVFAQWAKGAALARGELIWIAEADDIADQSFLERLTAYFDDPETAFAFCDSRAIDAGGNLLSESYKDYYTQSGAGTLATNGFDDARRFAAKHLSCRNLILNVSSVLWRRERLAQALADSSNDLSAYKLAGDWRLYLAACTRGGKIGYCAEPLNSHRRHEGGVTSRLNAERHVAEIERAQGYFNAAFGEDASLLRAQQDYREAIRAQFGLGPSKPLAVPAE